MFVAEEAFQSYCEPNLDTSSRNNNCRSFSTPNCTLQGGLTGNLSYGDDDVDRLRLDSCDLLNKNLRLLQIYLPSQVKEFADDNKSSLQFQFTPDCFSAQNPEAIGHVFHLLCQCYDYKEAEVRFRDVWPIYDKKTDSLFRRVISNWLKELIPRHSQFFVEVKLEALGSLLVNPIRDRFTQLVECFVDLVLSRTMSSDIAISPECSPVYNRPKYFNNPFTTSRQILFLRHQTSILVKNTAIIRKKMLKTSLNARKRQGILLERKQSFALEVEKKSRQVEYCKQKFPELNSTNDSQYSPSSCIETLGGLLPRQSEIHDRFAQAMKGIDSVFSTQLDSVANLREEVKKLFDRYKSFWYIIGRPTPQKLNVLDVDQLYISTSLPKPWTIQDYVDTILTVTKRFLQDDRLREPVPPDLLLKFKKSNLKFNSLKLCWKPIEAQRLAIKTQFSGCDLNRLLNDAKSNFMDIDWSILSKVDIPTLNKSFLITPTKKTKLASITGYTPRILNFLQPTMSKGHTSAPVNILSPNQISQRLYTSSPFNDITNQTSSLHNDVNLSIVGEIVSMVANSIPTPREAQPPISPVPSDDLNPKKPPLPNLRLSRPPFRSSQKSSTEVILPPPKHDTSINNAIVMNEDPVVDEDENDSELYSPDTEARLAKLLNSLSITPTASANSSVAELQFTCNTSFGGNPNSRRSSLALRVRTSLPSSNLTQPEGNKSSLVQNWSDDKGIMEMSFNSSWAKDMSDDE